MHRYEYDRYIYSPLETRPPHLAIAIEDCPKLRFERDLGYGSFGSVGLFTVTNANAGSQQQLAIKRFHRVSPVKPISHEVDILSAFPQHPHIISVTASFNDGFAMPFIDGFCLFDLIKNQASLNNGMHLTELFPQICAAVAHLHNHGFIHRDLKTENIMVSHSAHVTVTDFGLATTEIIAQNSRNVLGTPHFIAPETFHSGQTSKASDIYALSMVLYAMQYLCEPWPGASMSIIRFRILQGQRPLCPNLPATSPNYTGLIHSMWQPNPQLRPPIALVQQRFAAQRQSHNAATASPAVLGLFRAALTELGNNDLNQLVNAALGEATDMEEDHKSQPH